MKLNLNKLTSTDEIMVVETGDDVFLGGIEVEGDRVTILTGLRGRPKVLSMEEIESVTPASKHPDVEVAA